MTPETIDALIKSAQLGTNGMLIYAIYTLWKDKKDSDSRYLQMLERCVVALTRVNDHLEQEK